MNNNYIIHSFKKHYFKSIFKIKLMISNNENITDFNPDMSLWFTSSLANSITYFILAFSDSNFLTRD